MYKLIPVILIMIFSSCSNHKVLKIKKPDQTLFHKQNFCYEFAQPFISSKRIYKKKFLDKKRRSSDFYIQYDAKSLMQNIIKLTNDCPIGERIYINDIHVFKKNYSDTAQWKELFFVTVDVSYQGNNYHLNNSKFKDYESTGWVYVFKFQNENKIIAKTIQRALVRIFTDIEDAITNKLTLEQRNSKKDKDRLETEMLMDKYIKAQKNLEE